MQIALLKRTNRLGHTMQIQEGLYSLAGKAYFQLQFFTLWSYKQGGWRLFYNFDGNLERPTSRGMTDEL